MEREILINVEPKEIRIAVLEDKKLVDFFVERKDVSHLVGNIYKGRVTAIVPGIGAAFVDIGLEKNGFLFVSDIKGELRELEDEFLNEKGVFSWQRKKGLSIEEKLKVNDSVLVQVLKEPIGSKGVRLTTHISLPGRFLVLMPNENHIGISRRIEDKTQRNRLKAILKNLPIPAGKGVIIRTAGERAGPREFMRDLRSLLKIWERIDRLSKKVPTPYLLHEESDLITRILRDHFGRDVKRVVIDSRQVYKRAIRFITQFSPRSKSKITLYTGEIPLFEKMGVDKEIEKLYKRKVQLKCGGYIVIEQTESLVSVDVNTGKFVGLPGKHKKSLEETAFVVNKEAAEEIARQIRLRNLGGIIIIDFIDMESDQHRQNVLHKLEEALKKDKAKLKIYPFSELGLVEMTRQRVRQSIESIFYEECPYCQGRGKIKSLQTLANELLRRLKQVIQEKKLPRLILVIHPELGNKLVEEYRKFMQKIEKQFRTHIELRTEPHLHIEEFKILPS